MKLAMKEPRPNKMEWSGVPVVLQTCETFYSRTSDCWFFLLIDWLHKVVERLLAERKQPQAISNWHCNLSVSLFGFGDVATEKAEAEPSSGVESGRDQETDRHPFQMPVRLHAA